MTIIELLSLIFLAGALLITLCGLLYFVGKTIFSRLSLQAPKPWGDTQYKFEEAPPQPVETPAAVGDINDPEIQEALDRVRKKYQEIRYQVHEEEAAKARTRLQNRGEH